MSAAAPAPGGELARRLTLRDAVVVGLGAMLGAGVFAAPGPAAAVAGAWLPASLLIAALVAYANAVASARLAARHPESGGTYVYARERLGPFWGFLAGWCFVVGKLASLAAMALTFGAYVHGPLARPLGIAAVVVLAGVNAHGVDKTVRLTRAIVALVLAALAVAVAGALSAGPEVANLRGAPPLGVFGVFQGAGLLFFAFAGYARLATLGEEVVAPEVTIPRAIPLALGAVVAVYTVVLGAALLALGARELAEAPAPVAAAAEAGRLAWAAPVVRAGAGVAAAGVLLSLLAGVSRTTLAMARRRELPSAVAAVHPRHRTPHRAEYTAAAVVCAVVAVADLRHAIGFSSFAVLLYYGLANASAWTLGDEGGARRRRLAAFGVAACAGLALTLPRASVAAGAAVVAAGCVVWWLRRARARAR